MISLRIIVWPFQEEVLSFVHISIGVSQRIEEGGGGEGTMVMRMPWASALEAGFLNAGERPR
jgi:hypothetical protein